MTEAEAQVVTVARLIQIAIAKWLDEGDPHPEFGLRRPFLLDKLYPGSVIVQNKPLQQCWSLLLGEDRVPSHVDLAHALNSLAPKGRERLRLSALAPSYVRLDGQEAGPMEPIRVWSYAVPLAAVAEFRRPQNKDQICASRPDEEIVQLRCRIDDLAAENAALRRKLEDYELAEATPADLAASLGAMPVEIHTPEKFREKLPADPDLPAKTSKGDLSKKAPKRPVIRLKPKGW